MAVKKTTGGAVRKPRKKPGEGVGNQKYKHPPTHESRGSVKDQNPELPDGYNTKMIGFMMSIMPVEKLDYNDVPEMKRRFQRYLRLCEENDIKVGNLAAYGAIGINKDLAMEWMRNRSANPERSDFIKSVTMICSMYRESLMNDQKINPVTGIFWQKNYDGFRDQQEVVVTPTQPLGELTDNSRLVEKYLENADIVQKALPDQNDETEV